jgi:hypothetical protein
LVDYIKRLTLDVARVVHVHGGVDTMAIIGRAAGR